MAVPAPSPAPADIPVAVSRSWRQRVAGAAAWSVFVALYTTGLLFFAASSYCYWIMKGSAVEPLLVVFGLGIEPRYYRPIAVAYGAIALVHAVKGAQLTFSSARRRQLIFNSRVMPQVPHQTTVPSIYQATTRSLMHAYDLIFAETGLLGVSGPCFDLLLFVRELVETALQTVQAYRMSQFLSRVWLNRFYVSLLVLNCWLMALVHTLFHDKPMIRYFVTLTCDLLLDFTSSMVVPFTLVAIYSRDVDPDASDLFGPKWYDDGWVVHATSEFQIILVVSWADLLSRLVFALSMIGNLGTLQRLVTLAVKHPGASRTAIAKCWNSIIPEASRQPNIRPDLATIAALKWANGAVASNPLLTKLLRIVFVVWGSVVLALHAAAEVGSDLPQCVMRVRPWGITRPSCSFVLINCYQDHIAGSTSEAHARLVELNAPSVTLFAVRHCPALELPAVIQSLENLQVFKVYNSSIAQWDLDAALTKTSHPVISMLMLVRVRTLDGKIPLGLQSHDFPPTLCSLCFLDTNIREIPDDLDTKWYPGGDIEFDTAQLTNIPDVLVRMSPKFLVVAGNPLNQVSKEVFELPVLEYLDLSYTEVSALPNDVALTSSALTSFNLDGTNISRFPPWVDDWLQLPDGILYPQRISAAGSPYCAERDKIFAGELTNFTATSKSILMDASKGNWGFLQRIVSCAPSLMYRFSIVVEDMKAAIT